MDVNNGEDVRDGGGGNDGSNGGVDGANSHSRSCRGGNGEAKKRHTGRWSLGRMATIPIPAVQLAHYNIRPYASQPGSHKSLVALTLGKSMKKTTACGIDCSNRNDDDDADVDEADGSCPGRCRSASSNNNWLVKFTKGTY